MFQTKTLVAVPVYNEATHVAEVLAAIRRQSKNLLIIDDGSTDGTAEALRLIDCISVIRHDRNLGYGQALIDAFAYACRRRMDWIITMDCDGQHEPEAIPTFLAAIADDDCDIISGSRYLLAGDQAGSPPADRRAINGEITDLLNGKLSLRITDAFCGFKAYRVARLREMHLTEPGYAMPLQLWVEAWRLGLRVREIPIRLIYNDPNRSFGGPLDDPAHRREHYMTVLARALGNAHCAPREHRGTQPGRLCSSCLEPCCP